MTKLSWLAPVLVLADGQASKRNRTIMVEPM